jgi:glycerol-3-phosphate dehydrogenase
LLSLGGGKLTTYRRVAEKVVDRVVARLQSRMPERRFEACRTGEVPLPGARVDDPDKGGFRGFAKRLRTSLPAGVDDGVVRHWLHRYGTAAQELIARVAGNPHALRPIVGDLPYRGIEVTRAAESEMAETIDDVLRRRVPVSFRHADGGVEAAADVGILMGAALGWDARTTTTAVERYRTGALDERRRRGEPAAPADTLGADSRRRA